jgi:hypothetical protein
MSSQAGIKRIFFKYFCSFPKSVLEFSIFLYFLQVSSLEPLVPGYLNPTTILKVIGTTYSIKSLIKPQYIVCILVTFVVGLILQASIFVRQVTLGAPSIFCFHVHVLPVVIGIRR